MAIMSIALLAIIVLSVYTYIRSREEAHYQHMRYHTMTNKLQKLSQYVSKFRKEVKGEFSITDAEIKEQADKVMSVIGDAISREAVVVDKSFAENKMAVAALHALVTASTDSLKELIGKLDNEEKDQVLQFMKAMEARHIQIVSYLSEGGLDKVVNALATSITPEGFRSHEGFEQNDLDTKLKSLGVDLTPDQLHVLRDGILFDTTKLKMTPRESLYVRLSQLAPVVAKAKVMKSEELAAKVPNQDANTSAIVDNAKADIFNRIQELEIAHREATKAAAAGLYNNIVGKIDSVNADIASQFASTTATLNADMTNQFASTTATLTAYSDNLKSYKESQDATITEARKWSIDNLENLNAIKESISKIQGQPVNNL